MAFNVMIVDDSETMRQVLRRVVEMSGVPVGEFHEADNGGSALKVLRDTWIDVILSDINMPEMDGVELLKQLKQDKVFKRIPVIFITTESSEARRREAKELGVAGYIKKPFVPETIREILLDVLAKAYDVKSNDFTRGNEEGMDF